MFILSIVLLIAVIVYFFLCKKNTITYLIAINILSAYTMLFFSVLYSSKLTTYVTSIGYDYQIYRWLFSKLNLHIWTICRLFNCSLFAYLISNTIFCVKLNGNKFTVSVFFMMFSAVFCVVWNSIEVSQMIYIYIKKVKFQLLMLLLKYCISKRVINI